jgi:ABC-type enterobactin transport system permease subunit
VGLTVETRRFYERYLNVTLDAAAARKVAMKRPLTIPFLLAVLGLTAPISLYLGRYPVTLSDLRRFLFLQSSHGASAPDSRQLHLLKNIIIDIRLPRIAAAILIGAALMDNFKKNHILLYGCRVCSKTQ